MLKLSVECMECVALHSHKLPPHIPTQIKHSRHKFCLEQSRVYRSSGCTRVSVYERLTQTNYC